MKQGETAGARADSARGNAGYGTVTSSKRVMVAAPAPSSRSRSVRVYEGPATRAAVTCAQAPVLLHVFARIVVVTRVVLSLSVAPVGVVNVCAMEFVVKRVAGGVGVDLEGIDRGAVLGKVGAATTDHRATIEAPTRARSKTTSRRTRAVGIQREFIEKRSSDGVAAALRRRGAGTATSGCGGRTADHGVGDPVDELHLVGARPLYSEVVAM